MQYTLEETIELLKDRIKLSKENKGRYAQAYKDAMDRYDMNEANKNYRYMLEENSVLTELNYLLTTITGKGVL